MTGSNHFRTGAHFNLPGHSLADMKATIIEHVKKQSDIYRKERENFFIRKFNTFHAGLNKRQQVREIRGEVLAICNCQLFVNILIPNIFLPTF